jgi:chromosome partitioning protein
MVEQGKYGNKVRTMEKKKVLVVDVDPQSNVTRRCGVYNVKNEYECMVDVFERNSSPINTVIKSPIKELPLLDLLPSSMKLTPTEMLLVTKPFREFILKNYFENHKDFFERYDYILIDTAPNLNLLNQNALCISDSIILISEVSGDSLEGCKIFIDAWSELSKIFGLDNNIKGIVINKFDKRTSLSKQFVDYVKGNPELRDLSFDTIIPENIQVKKSENEGIPLCLFDAKCAAYEALVDLTKEFVDKGVL